MINRTYNVADKYATVWSFKVLHLTSIVAMPGPWVHSSFKHLLIESSAEYLRSSDKGKDKTRTKLSETVADQIRDVASAQHEPIKLPDTLSKVFSHFNTTLTTDTKAPAVRDGLVAKWGKAGCEWWWRCTNASQKR